MGLGPSKVDYKERNFTETPLTDEEIDFLMKIFLYAYFRYWNITVFKIITERFSFPTT